MNSVRIDNETVAVVLWNNRHVIGVTTLDKTAYQHKVGEMETDVLLVKLHRYVATLLGENIFQERCGFLGQNDRCFDTRFHGGITILHQNIAVGSDKDNIVGVNIHAHTVHNRPQLIVGCGKKAAGNAIEQDRGWHGESCGILTHGRDAGDIHSH